MTKVEIPGVGKGVNIDLRNWYSTLVAPRHPTSVKCDAH